MADDRTDSEDSRHQTWLDRPRNFVDKRSEEAAWFNSLLGTHLTSWVETWDCDENGWTFNLHDAVIEVLNEEIGSPKVTVVSQRMSRNFLDRMRMELRAILQGSLGLDWSPSGFAITLLQLVEEGEAWRQDWKSDVARKMLQNRRSVFSHRRKDDQYDAWDSRKVRGWSSVLDNPYGLNLSTVEDTTQDLLGESIADICSRVPEYLRILHVEPVYRHDLVTRFLRRKNRILRHLLEMPYKTLRECVAPKVIRPGSASDTRYNLAQELARPSVTFHGAPRRVIESIVRYGFTIPGQEIGDTGTQLLVRCGMSFGLGVYSSPDPVYASFYNDYRKDKPGAATQPNDVPGMRLVVCATLMGRPMRVGYAEAWSKTEPLSKEAHSHVSPNELEYIVLDSAQIIPCYVLYLDYGAEQARKEFEAISANPRDYFQRRSRQRTVNKWDAGREPCPGDIQRKKQALKAAAQKWFPFGYGSAQGTSFVIEDVAEISDDEETYGEFQYQRIEQEAEIRERVLEEGESWFDQYQLARNTTALYVSK